MAEVKEERRPFGGPVARAKLFKHGGSQAVRLPKEFRFEGEEVEVRRDGDRVILEPVTSGTPRTQAERAAFWARLDAICDEPLIAPPRDGAFFHPLSPLDEDGGDH